MATMTCVVAVIAYRKTLMRMMNEDSMLKKGLWETVFVFLRKTKQSQMKLERVYSREEETIRVFIDQIVLAFNIFYRLNCMFDPLCLF